MTKGKNIGDKDQKKGNLMDIFIEILLTLQPEL